MMDTGRLTMRPREELPLDFDGFPWSDDADWWKQQDTELEQQELDRLEAQAEIEDYRLNGYGE